MLTWRAHTYTHTNYRTSTAILSDHSTLLVVRTRTTYSIPQSPSRKHHSNSEFVTPNGLLDNPYVQNQNLQPQKLGHMDTISTNLAADLRNVLNWISSEADMPIWRATTSTILPSLKKTQTSSFKKKKKPSQLRLPLSPQQQHWGEKWWPMQSKNSSCLINGRTKWAISGLTLVD